MRLIRKTSRKLHRVSMHINKIFENVKYKSSYCKRGVILKCIFSLFIIIFFLAPVGGTHPPRTSFRMNTVKYYCILRQYYFSLSLRPLKIQLNDHS